MENPTDAALEAMRDRVAAARLAHEELAAELHAAAMKKAENDLFQLAMFMHDYGLTLSVCYDGTEANIDADSLKEATVD